jgi:hypothetical protein
MALEDRVKTLEHELNILKNEIQSTLLDIQEHILTHRYPSLRAEEPFPPGTVRQPSSSTSAERIGVATVERVTPPDSQAFLRRTGEGLAESHLLSEGPSPSRPEEEMHAAGLTELVEWMGNSVGRIGGERTRRVIEAYTKAGHLPPGHKDVLLQLISLSGEEKPSPNVGMKDILDVTSELNDMLGDRTDMSDALSLLKEEGFG